MSTHLTKPHLLVVGGTGFIGYHLVYAAKKRGWNVTSLSTHKPKNYRAIKGVNYKNVDISNLSKLKKKLVGSFTYVVNLGGYVAHVPFKKNGEKIIKSHFNGVVNLVTILNRKKIKKFIQIGSSVEYGINKSPQVEKFDGEPDTHYASAKLASTKFLIEHFKINKFPACILRLFQVYGPNQDKNRFIPQIIKGCLKNQKFPTSKGNQIRDFCFIDDVVNAVFIALQKTNSSGEIYNIGSGKSLKVKNVINKIKKIIRKGQPQFGKIKYRKNENMNLYPSIKKVKKNLKWKPKYSFSKGINITINSYRDK